MNSSKLLITFIFLFGSILNYAQTPAKNKVSTRKFYDAFNARNFDAIKPLVADNFKDYALPPELAKETGLQGFPLLKSFIDELYKGFPDIKMQPIQLVAEKDYVIAYITMSGTHNGDFMGLPPTGKSFNLTDADIIRFDKKGKAVEHWAIQDGTAMMAQLGLMPSSPYIQTVKDLYADFSKGNIEGVLSKLSEEVVWTDAGTNVLDLYIGTRKGKKEVLDFFQKLNQYLNVSSFEAQNYAGIENKVAVKGHISGTAKTTGEAYDTDWFMLWSFDDHGKVNFHQLFLDTDNISKAIKGRDFSQAGMNFLTAMDASDLAGLKAVTAPDFKIYHPNFPESMTVEQFYEKQVVPFNKAFSDFTHTIIDSSLSGNKLTMRGLAIGKHVRELMGIQPTGVELSVPWIAFATLDNDGKMKELHVQFNQLSFLAQLGVNPLAVK